MRNQGIEAKRALEILRPQIKQLSSDGQSEVVRQVRLMEAQSDDIPTGLTEPRKPTIKPISQPLPKIDPKTLSKLARTLPVSESAAEMGYSLEDKSINTRKLGEEGNARDSFFGSESILVLIMRETNLSFKLRPQNHPRPLVLGRTDGAHVVDVDLTELGAASMGVSRAHVTLHYDARSATLAVKDMNTVNGTFINGVKLLPQEVRVLRHGDELRMGHMIMIAHFYFAEG
jgi:hypothetical protein